MKIRSQERCLGLWAPTLRKKHDVGCLSRRRANMDSRAARAATAAEAAAAAAGRAAGEAAAAAEAARGRKGSGGRGEEGVARHSREKARTHTGGLGKNLRQRQFVLAGACRPSGAFHEEVLELLMRSRQASSSRVPNGCCTRNNSFPVSVHPLSPTASTTVRLVPGRDVVLA